MIRIVLSLALAAAPQGPAADPRAAVRRILEQGGYQRELPLAEGGAESAAPAGAEPPAGGADGGRRGRSPRDTGFPVSGSCGKAVVWIVGGVMAVLLLAQLVALVRGHGADVRDEPAARPPRPRPLAATPVLRQGVLEDADRLAAAGDYAAAIRVLLERTFAVLHEAGIVRVIASHTSRELAQQAQLDPKARGHLGELVTAVELSLFARREPGRQDYALCAAAFRTLAHSVGGAA